uniref:hypothetical protein n=1 Tax=uncultured Polaribacter sp. TaxID=174711 RepID=UPI0026222D85|nr:hypothetical protein [uncultured Polaribacter sp.]
MDVKRAIKIAENFLLEQFPKATDIDLEEIEITEDKEFWYITLSYLDEVKDEIQQNRKRFYKIFKIENETFIVYAMKIREFKNPL